MKKIFIPFEIFILIMAIIVLIVNWIAPISIETEFIPTVVNGLTSSISLIVGFTGAFIIVTLQSNPSFEPSRAIRIMMTVFILISSIGMLWSSYFNLTIAKYHEALRYAMTGLVISFATLFDFIAFLTLGQ